jgi:peroxiredoxin Q/BCP
MITEGQPFPNFSLPDQDGTIVTLDSLKGQKTVIYFYPKDDTTGCTAQACSFRDTHADFASLGVRVIGVSPDPSKSHRKFADKFELNFTLLADADHALADAAGVWVEKSLYGRKYMGVDRTTFLLDADGTVLKIWRKVKPQNHAQAIQSELSG